MTFCCPGAPFLTVRTTGETPVPQFCYGLLWAKSRRFVEARACGGSFSSDLSAVTFSEAFWNGNNPHHPV